MRALLLSLVASVAWAQSTPAPRFKRFTQRTEQGRNTRGLLAESLAFFEAFPSSGAGLTSACSATAPTGAKGETLTLTRASTAYCSRRGMAVTGIQPGDLVSMSANVARTEPDSQGVLGLRVESSRVNWLARGEEFENAAWVKGNFATSALPVVTANAGTAPDGTRTADRIWYDACPDDPGQSLVYQQTASSAARSVHNVYIRGCIPLSDAGCVDETLTDSGDGGVQFADGGVVRGPDGGVGRGTMSVCMYNGAADPTNNTCIQCAYSALSWTRCENNFGGSGTSPYTMFGCIRNTTTYSNGINVGVGEVLAWGAQQEGVTTSPSYSTSYAGTAGSSGVTRSAETASFAISALTVSAPWSAASTTQLPAVVPTNARVGGAAGTTGLAVALYDSYASAGVLQAFSSQVTPNNYSTGLSVTANATARYATYHDGTLFNGCVNASCAAGVSRAWTNLANVTTISVGTYSGSGAIDGIQSRICFQPGDAARCR